MKIALLHKRLDLKGGTERDLYRSAEGLRDLGHEVHLFCAEFGVEPPAQTFHHKLAGPPAGRTARLWATALLARGIMEGSGCDVVIGFGRFLRQDIVRSGGGTHRGFLERLAQAGGARRRAWQFLSPYHRSVLALERRQFAAGAFRRIIAVSQEVKRDIIEHYGVPAERISVLYNGVDTARFQPSVCRRYRREVRAQWHIPDNAPVVLFAGSGFRRKGLDRLLAVWKRPALRDVYLLVVGEDGALERYRGRAASIAGERIILTGHQDDIERFYGAADVLALPSIQEAFGNVVLEGLACGLPVVVARGAGAAEILNGDAARGIVADPDSADELASKITAQLEWAAEPRHFEALSCTVADYSWDHHFAKLDALLQEVWCEKRREQLA
jgi:UDP-glucose:(heptosyl)LPS alpha-1,3-glucosyltransferase